MNCPLCGATERSRGTGKIWWECGSYQYEDRRSYFQESTECLRRQLAEMTRCRDLAVQGHHTEIDMQLTAAKARIKELEAADAAEKEKPNA